MMVQRPGCRVAKCPGVTHHRQCDGRAVGRWRPPASRSTCLRDFKCWSPVFAARRGLVLARLLSVCWPAGPPTEASDSSEGSSQRHRQYGSLTPPTTPPPELLMPSALIIWMPGPSHGTACSSAVRWSRALRGPNAKQWHAAAAAGRSVGRVVAHARGGARGARAQHRWSRCGRLRYAYSSSPRLCPRGLSGLRPCRLFGSPIASLARPCRAVPHRLARSTSTCASAVARLRVIEALPPPTVGQAPKPRFCASTKRSIPRCTHRAIVGDRLHCQRGAGRRWGSVAHGV